MTAASRTVISLFTVRSPPGALDAPPSLLAPSSLVSPGGAAPFGSLTWPGSRRPVRPTATASRTRALAPTPAVGCRRSATGCLRRHSTWYRGSTCRVLAGRVVRYTTDRRVWPAPLPGFSPARALSAAGTRADRSAGAGPRTRAPDTPGSARSRRSRPRGPRLGWSAGLFGEWPKATPSALAGQYREARVGARPRVTRGVAEQFLDPQQLVVFRHPLAARGRARLDLAAVGRDGQIRDRRVVGLTGPVADHAAEPGAVGQAHRVQGLGDRADLIQLDQQGVG